VRVRGKDVGGAGHIAAAGAVADVAHWVVLDTDVFATWIVHDVAIVVSAEVAVLAWVVVAVVIAADVENADVVAIVAHWLAFDAVVVIVDVVARWLAFDAVVVVVGAVIVAVCCFDIAVGGGVVVVGNLRLLRLCYRGRIAVSNS